MNPGIDDAACVMPIVILAALLSGVLLIVIDLLSRLPLRRPILGGDGDGPFTFPAGFLWGTATADHQIERAQPDDWTAFELSARKDRKQTEMRLGLVEPGHIAGIADVPLSWIENKTNHDDHIDDDIALCKAVGNNAYRFSISWARLFPRADMTAPDPEGLAFYDRVLDACEKHGQQPSATLLHFASPQWLWQPDAEGRKGYERGDAVDHFRRFAEVCATRWGQRIQHWCTINEPMVLVYFGYLEGVFPPNLRRANPKLATPVAAQLLRFHVAGYEAIKAARHDALVGIAHHVRHFVPYRNGNPLDRFTAMMVDRAFTLDFMDAIHTGLLRPAFGGGIVEIPGLKGTMDYVGLNFYGRFYVKSTTPGKFEIISHDKNEYGEEETDVGWAVDEGAFTFELQRFHDRYELPIYILESGIADRGGDSGVDDAMRQRFLVRHVQSMWQAVRAGVDVKGFFYWSLFDNFEWAAGFGPCFGLYRTDYTTHTRTPRDGAAIYKEIAQSNGLSTSLWSRFRRALR